MGKENQNRYDDEISLLTFETIEGRKISYATTGDCVKGKRIAFFYPMGANRRFLIHLHTLAQECSLYLICVNRPGCGQTDDPEDSEGPKSKQIVESVCNDLIHTMKFLDIDKLDGILSMCAGNPFSLSFVSQYPNKFRDNRGKILSIASYVLPADCPESKSLHRFGAQHIPIWISSAFAGSSMTCMQWSLRNCPSSNMLIKSLRNQFVGEEREYFDTKITDKEKLVKHLQWMTDEKPTNFSGDLSVLLSPSNEMDIDYSQIQSKILLLHGEEDKLAPMRSIDWLAEKLPNATVISIPNATHDGTLFMLHSQIEDNLKTFFDN